MTSTKDEKDKDQVFASEILHPEGRQDHGGWTATRKCLHNIEGVTSILGPHVPQTPRHDQVHFPTWIQEGPLPTQNQGPDRVAGGAWGPRPYGEQVEGEVGG